MHEIQIHEIGRWTRRPWVQPFFRRRGIFRLKATFYEENFSRAAVIWVRNLPRSSLATRLWQRPRTCWPRSTKQTHWGACQRWAPLIRSLATARHRARRAAGRRATCTLQVYFRSRPLLPCLSLRSWKIDEARLVLLSSLTTVELNIIDYICRNLFEKPSNNLQRFAMFDARTSGY